MIAIYILLGVIIALLIYVIIQNNEMKNEIINAGNYLSEKIDNITSSLNVLRDEMCSRYTSL